MTGRGTPIRGTKGCRAGDRQLVAWGVVGLTAQALFMAGWLIAETWQGARYSPVKSSISDLQAASAPHAWFPIACFALGGLGTFAFVVFGLRPALAGATVAAYAPWMLALSALALGNSFPQVPCRLADPGCTAKYQLHSAGGLTDATVASIAFVVLAITPFPLWRRLAALPQWRRLRPVMMAARVLGPVLFVLLAASSTMASMPANGLIERLLVSTLVLWTSALAINLIVTSRRAGVPGALVLTAPAAVPGDRK
jgi:hypothetical protein